MFKWFDDWLFKISTRKCTRCGERYYPNEAGYTEAKRVDVSFYRDYYGKLRISTRRPRYECCKECARKHREAEDFRLFGITPEDRERARKFKEEKDKQLREAFKRISEWEKKSEKTVDK